MLNEKAGTFEERKEVFIGFSKPTESDEQSKRDTCPVHCVTVHTDEEGPGAYRAKLCRF